MFFSIFSGEVGSVGLHALQKTVSENSNQTKFNYNFEWALGRQITITMVTSQTLWLEDVVNCGQYLKYYILIKRRNQQEALLS